VASTPTSATLRFGPHDIELDYLAEAAETVVGKA
jgi:hypothetical protein